MEACKRLVLDIETDGFLDVCTVIHCIVMYDLDTKEYLHFNNQGGPSIVDAIELMNNADELYAHYLHGFDAPAIKKLYPEFNPKRGAMYDTITMAKSVYRNLKSLDFEKVAKGNYPADFVKSRHIGSFSLKSWGIRLGELKTTIADDDGITDWSKWTPEMEEYCEQDVRVTVHLLNLLLKDKNLLLHPMHCHDLDNRFQHILARQMRRGIYFDEGAAKELCGELQQESYELDKELRHDIKPFFKREGEFTPKRDNRSSGYAADAPLSKLKTVEFNPGSRDHISNRLIKLYGWEPSAFGKDGKPTIDESTLAGLAYPIIPQIRQYLGLNKFLGMLHAGPQAWLRAVKNSRLHGYIDPVGTVSWRCSHSKPNLGQVPGVSYDSGGSLLLRVEGGFGAESRRLFQASPGYVLCGHDAAGLELRCLSHYMAKYDGGAYAKEVAEGDVHTTNQRAIGLNSRSNAKTWVYAFIFGAQDYLLGKIVIDDFTTEKRDLFLSRYSAGSKQYDGVVTRIGRDSRSNFERGLPALAKLVKAIKAKAKRDGYLTALDGRRLVVRSQHSCVNLLMQSCGAIIMRRWLVILDERLQDAGLVPIEWGGKDYEFVANVHDEAQTEVLPEHVELYHKIAIESFPATSDYYDFKCLIEGEGKQGNCWFDTH